VGYQAFSLSTVPPFGRGYSTPTSVSAGLVALAFAGQASNTGLMVFGLVILPVLFFLGLVTFARVLQSSIEDALHRR
jgi:high-affinity nickel permease